MSDTKNFSEGENKETFHLNGNTLREAAKKVLVLVARPLGGGG